MIKDDRLHGQTCTLSNIGAVGGSQAYTAIIDYPIPWGLAQFQQVGESFSSNLVQYNYIYIISWRNGKTPMGISWEKNKSIGEKEKMLSQIPSTATVEHDIIVIYIYTRYSECICVFVSRLLIKGFCWCSDGAREEERYIHWNIKWEGDIFASKIIEHVLPTTMYQEIQINDFIYCKRLDDLDADIPKLWRKNAAKSMIFMLDHLDPGLHVGP